MARLTASGIQFDLLNPSDAITSFYWIYPAGTKKLFYQSTAPTGWTQDTTHGNKSLRVVNGTGGGSGNTRSWTQVLSATNTMSVAISGTFPVTASVGGHTLSLSQLANHTHALLVGPASGSVATPFSNSGTTFAENGSTQTGGAGGGGAHNHPFSGSVTVNETANLGVSIAVQYVDVIICTLN